MSSSSDDQETHRFFAPSASSRWLSCTASAIVDVSELPERRRPSADRGTLLHAEGEKCLRDGTLASHELSPPDQESVNAYVRFVREKPGTKLYEYKADLPELLGLCGGTSDCVVIEPEPDVLEIVDYKSGSGFVDPLDNTQLAIYWLAVHAKLAHLGNFRKARLTIAQPALNNFNSWNTSRRSLLRLGQEIVATVERIMDGDVEFVPTEDNCRFCDAKPICPAFHDMATQAARDDFREHPDKKLAELAETTVEEMDWGQRLRLVPLLRQWCKAVESATSSMLLQGEDVPGFKVVQGRKGNRAWSDQKQAVTMLSSWGADEKDLFPDPPMISPAKAEAWIKERADGDKALAKERREELSVTWQEGAPGPPTVVPESDSRPALNKADLARRDFGFDDEDDGE